MDGPEPLPQFVAYPRGNPVYGSTDKLRALANGYFELTNIFFYNVILMIAGIGTYYLAPESTTRVIVLVLGVLLISLAIGFASYRCNRQIGYAMDWRPRTAIVVSLLMGAGATTCLSAFCYAWVQTIAGKEIRRYGVKSGFIGLLRSDVERTIRDREAQQPPGLRF
jgi:hypothetical protein